MSQPHPESPGSKVEEIGVDHIGDIVDRAHDAEILRLENMDTDVGPPLVALEATRQAVGRDACNSYLPLLKT